MTGRLLPGKNEFEDYVLAKVVAALEASGNVVTDSVKGDSEEIPFDWLICFENEPCLGLEVVRAEDQTQVHHVEKETRAGETVINGTAEPSWDSLVAAIDSKLANANRYREALGNLCEGGQLHLAVTSGLQQLQFNGAVGEEMEKLARCGLGAFDTVWLVQGDLVRRLD